MTPLPPVMPVAVYRAPGEVAVEERPVPAPGDGEVLVEVGHCGICGSDLHLMLEGWGTPGLVGGHEFSGTVAAVGKGVSGWAVGQVVVGGPSPRCGTCRRCREGKPSQCERRRGRIDAHLDNGAFARYILVGAPSLRALPPGLSPREAALAEPLAVALHGITRSGVVEGDRVMVFGAGPIGALSIAALVARGIEVTVVEPGESRRRLAAALGASEVVSPDALETHPPWQPEEISPRAVDVVLECSGRKAAMEAGFHQLRRGGRLVLVGAGMEAPSFDPNRFLLNELEVCGSFVYDADGFERALELLASGALPTSVLIEPRDVGLGQISGALGDLAAGRLAGKVMVVPGAGGKEAP
ncbi:MAG TPA: alcohol dehydrogenase catalytic domain-containing protein [Acidimicrobiales bacterium]|nr:alcohol dehydrogenase catalytic domain-containing protein [Acidimicrobiales bacterium]